MTQSRYQRLTMTLAAIILTYGILAYQLTRNVTGLPFVLSLPITLLTSAALFKLMLSGFVWLVGRSGMLLSLYLGSKRYWRGFWHYTSSHDGKLHLGLWNVEQDVRRTRIRAVGLDENYGHRFDANAIADPMEDPTTGKFEIVYEFNYDEDDRRTFAVTEAQPDQLGGKMLSGRGPHVLTGKTFNYGGSLNENRYTNVKFVRHDDVKSEDELIAKLKASGLRHGGPFVAARD